MTDMVYLLTSLERFKIGVSSDPRVRRTALRKQSGFDLRLYAMIPGQLSLEQRILRHFRHLRIENEWFQPSVEIANWFRWHRNAIDPGWPYHRDKPLWSTIEPDHWIRDQVIKAQGHARREKT